MQDSGSIRQYLPLLLDKTTTVNSPEITARVNVNTAPRAVLAALPGLTSTDVDNIVEHRPTMSTPDTPDSIFQTPAWLITEANFPPQTLKTLERYVTARSLVYRIQSIGYFDGGGPTARIEAVIDGNNQRPRIISWRDLTELGKGFDIGSP
jgi:type II secretory pathway component PulK